jgi:hypothetical protein
MTPKARATYFALWQAAAVASGWSHKDEAKRRAVTTECMRLVRGPVVKSSSDLGEDEITALFCYLEHLGDAASLDKSARWDTCRADYKTYARAKNADWHEEQTYGKGKNKLDRNRFKGETSAKGGPLDDLDPDKVKKRYYTMANRHASKLKREKGQNLASQKPTTLAFPIGTDAPAPVTPAAEPAHERTEPPVEAFDAANPFG